jgi:hypothetical protein
MKPAMKPFAGRTPVHYRVSGLMADAAVSASSDPGDCGTDGWSKIGRAARIHSSAALWADPSWLWRPPPPRRPPMLCLFLSYRIATLGCSQLLSRRPVTGIQLFHPSHDPTATGCCSVSIDGRYCVLPTQRRSSVRYVMLRAPAHWV